MLYRTARRSLDLSARTHVMGILNVTPDSFSDGGRHLAVAQAVAHAKAMIAAGADIVDIGGESTRPGATVISAAEETARVLPVIEALAPLGFPLSIDTYKAAVADAALAAGAEIVNDIGGLMFDGAMAAAIARHGAACVIMSNAPGRADMHAKTGIDVKADLERKVALALAAGIARDRIAVDPGIGFGKTQRENLELHLRLRDIAPPGLPVLFASSRKRFIRDVGGSEDRLPGSLASVALAAAHGAHIVRVHDVRETVSALKLTDAVLGTGP